MTVFSDIWFSSSAVTISPTPSSMAEMEPAMQQHVRKGFSTHPQHLAVDQVSAALRKISSHVPAWHFYWTVNVLICQIQE